MKEGDKFINITKSESEEYNYFRIYTIEKFSKDGKKIRTLDRNVLEVEDKENLTSTLDVQNTITRLFKTEPACKHFLVRFVNFPTKSEFGEIYPVIPREDEFDETVHIRSKEGRFTVNANLAEKPGFSKIKEVKIEEHHIESYWFITGLDGLTAFFAEKTNLPVQNEPALLERFNEWQEKFGFDKTDELWTDFLGGTTQLEWAIDNDIDCSDYDRWQCLQKALKHELKYETVNEICNTLYDKEELEILNYL